MAAAGEAPRIPIQLSRKVLVASLQVDLDEAVLAGFREDILGRIHESGARGVILDVSGLDTLDPHEFVALRSLIEMIRVMGARALLVGLKPGVVAALIMTDAPTDGVEAARDLDEAFLMLEPVAEEDADEADDVPEDEEDVAEAGASE